MSSVNDVNEALFVFRYEDANSHRHCCDVIKEKTRTVPVLDSHADQRIPNSLASHFGGISNSPALHDSSKFNITFN